MFGGRNGYAMWSPDLSGQGGGGARAATSRSRCVLPRSSVHHPATSLATAATLIGPSVVADSGTILVSSHVSASRTPHDGSSYSASWDTGKVVPSN